MDDKTLQMGVDDQVVLHVELGTPIMSLNMAGQVRAIKQTSSPPGIDVAIMFVNLDQMQKGALKEAALRLAMQKIRLNRSTKNPSESSNSGNGPAQ